jgi:hypothetical protein
MNKFIVFLHGAVFFLISCEEKTGWDLQQSDPFAVADCIVTNEMKQQELRLYRSSAEMNAEPAGISGAIISVNDGNTSMQFQEDKTQPGRYLSVLPFRASAGIIYRLIITLGDKSDTADAEMTGITPLGDIQIAAKDSLFRFEYRDTPQASMTDVFYDWSAAPAYCSAYGACQASETYYTLDNIDAGKVFAPERQVILFPHQTRIIRRKYSLSEAHQQFIRALLLETEWRGGLFDAEQGNVPTNFHHGIRGWFAASMVLSDTTYFK